MSRKGSLRGKIVFWSIILALIFFVTALATVFYYVKELPNPDSWQTRQVVQSTKIFDRTGQNILYEIHGEEKRTVVAFDRIPDLMKQATIVAEDAEFYQHSGINFRGILRAVTNDFLNRKLAEGGSSITQQLIKNAYLSNEKTFSRKIKEAILAIEMERKYSKNEILNFYLNQIPYGSNSYGIEAASLSYFGKHVWDVDLVETAYLAALPKAPSYYSPYGSHFNDLKNRADYILDRMHEYKYISDSDYKTAKKASITFLKRKEKINAPHFVFFIRDYLDNKYGEDVVEKGGLKVTTTLDQNLQEIAEKIVKEGAERNEAYQAANAALVAMDPKTGQILAMVGSKNYFGDPEPEGCAPGKNCRFDGNVNVTTSLRQPGSAFKPFVYAAAFRKGYTPDTVVWDVPTEFSPLCNWDRTPGLNVSEDTCYHPVNYDGLFRGPVTFKQALSNSLNVPSVKVLYLAGINDAINLAEDMGITTLKDRSRYGLSLVLGGAEVKLLDMVGAYSVFANDGIKMEPTAIVKVEDSNGNILEEYREQSQRVIDAEIARIISDILSDNTARAPMFGLNSPLNLGDRPAAVKTGTTQDYRDAWTVGYTPTLVAGVWVGNNDNTEIQKSGAGAMVAAPLWHDFIKKALEESPAENFAEPELILSDKPILNGQYYNQATLKINKTNGLLATEKTPADQIVEKTFKQIHEILWWLDKNNPQGPLPDNPESDSQYQNWESAIQVWLGQNPTNFTNQNLPQDFDH